MSQLNSIQDEPWAAWMPRLAAHAGPRFLQIADALQLAKPFTLDGVQQALEAAAA